MTWNVALRPDGMFTVTNEVNHHLFSGAFPPNLSQDARLKVLNLVCEANAMLALLRALLAEVDAMIQALIQEHGSETAVKERAPGVLVLRQAIADQIKRAEGG